MGTSKGYSEELLAKCAADVARGKTYQDLAREHGVDRSRLSEAVRRYMAQDKNANVRNVPSRELPWFHKFGVQHDDGKLLELTKLPERVLAFSCSQAPLHHESTIPFLGTVIADTKPDLVVMAGDIVDFTFMKPAFTHPDGDSPSAEIEKAREFCEQLGRLIPRAVMLTSNHAEGRIANAQKNGNLPTAFVRPWQEVVGIPPEWVTRDYLIAGRYLFEHGDGVSKGARTSLREEMIRRFGRPLSVIRGHRHNLFGEVMAPYWEAPTHQTRLAYLGCTMDASKVSYTKSGLWNGCILINRGAIEPIPMERDKSGKWTCRLVQWG